MGKSRAKSGPAESKIRTAGDGNATKHHGEDFTPDASIDDPDQMQQGELESRPGGKGNLLREAVAHLNK